MKNTYKEMEFKNFIDIKALVYDLKLLGIIAVMVIAWLVIKLMRITILIIKFAFENIVESSKFCWRVLCTSWRFACAHIFPTIVKFFVYSFSKIMGRLSNLKNKIVAAEQWRMDMILDQCDMIKYRAELAKLTLNVPLIEDRKATW